MGQAGPHSGRTSVRPATTTLKFTPLGASPRTKSRSARSVLKRLDRAALGSALRSAAHDRRVSGPTLVARSWSVPTSTVRAVVDPSGGGDGRVFARALPRENGGAEAHRAGALRGREPPDKQQFTVGWYQKAQSGRLLV